MKTKVLFVDDDATALEIVESKLGERYDLKTASNAGDAYIMIEEFNPDIVVTDIVIPGMSGLTLSEAIQSHQIPVIIVSVHQDALQQAQNAGAAKALVKPYKTDELCRSIDQVVEEGRKHKTKES